MEAAVPIAYSGLSDAFRSSLQPVPAGIQLMATELEVWQKSISESEAARLSLQVELAAQSSELALLRQRHFLDQASERCNNQKAELRVELNCALQMRDVLRKDANDEAAVAAGLRQQLASSEAGMDSMAVTEAALEASRLCDRTQELEADLARSASVCDELQLDLVAEITTAVMLRQQLAVAEALGQAGSSHSWLGRQRQDEHEALPNTRLAELQGLVQELGHERDLLRLELEQSHMSEAAEASELRAQIYDLEFHSANMDAQHTTAFVQTAVSAAPGPYPILTPLPDAAPKRPTSRLDFRRVQQAAKDNDLDTFHAVLHGAACTDGPSLLRMRGDDGSNLLQTALEADAFDVVQLLLLECKTWAARQKHLHALQGELLEREFGQLVNGRDARGCGALSFCCQQKKVGHEVVALLLEAQADPSQPDDSGMTPFLECARHGNCAVMILLLRATRGVVLNDTDIRRRSAIHWAAQGGQTEAVELLLKVEADPEALDMHGLTAAAVARTAGHLDLSAKLAEILSDEALEEFMAEAGEGHASNTQRIARASEVEEDEHCGNDFEIPEEAHMLHRFPSEESDGPPTARSTTRDWWTRL